MGYYINITKKGTAKAGSERKMMSSSYILATEEEIIVGNTYYFGQLWDGNGDGAELLESGSISPDGESIVEFAVKESSADICKTLVIITDIF